MLKQHEAGPYLRTEHQTGSDAPCGLSDPSRGARCGDHGQVPRFGPAVSQTRR